MDTSQIAGIIDHTLDFVKTSTGFVQDGATIADIKLIRRRLGREWGSRLLEA